MSKSGLTRSRSVEAGLSAVSYTDSYHDASHEFYHDVASIQPFRQDKRRVKVVRMLLDTCPTLILLGVTFLFQTMPATYMPVVLKQDFDIPESTSALIISAFTFTYILSCFVSPKLDRCLDPNLIMILAYFLFLLAGIAFSFITGLPRSLLPGVAITLRAVAGFAAGVYENIASTVLVRKFSNNIGTLSASVEAAINLGCLTGPILGGALYTWTGRFSTACLIPMCAAAVVFIWFVYQASQELEQEMRSNANSSSSSGSDGSKSGGGFLKVLSSWQMVLFLCLPFYGSFIINLPMTTTAPHIYNNFGKGSVAAGLLFLLDSVGYMVCVLLSGFLTDMPRFKELGLWFFAICPFIQAFGNLLIGPAFFLPYFAPFLPSYYFAPSYYWIACGFFISSSAFGLACGPGLRSLTALWRGLYPDCEEDYSAYITSIFLVTFSLGEGAGNAVGGLLYDYIGYNTIVTVFGLSLCLHGLLNTVFIVMTRNKPYMKAIVNDIEDFDCCKPLLNRTETERESESESDLSESENDDSQSLIRTR